MGFAVGARMATALVAAGLLLAACADHPGAAGGLRSSPAASSPTVTASTPSTSAPPVRRAARPTRQQVASAMTTVRSYLRAWATEGPARASRYLVPGQRVTSDVGMPRIRAGSVTSYRLQGWKGPREFTLLVSMDLEFTNDPMGWNAGANDRFVTAHRVGDHYLLELATSP